MSLKRLQREEGNTSDERRTRKPPSFKSVVLDVMNIQRLQNSMVPVLEPLIRRVVKEEVDSALRKYVVCMKRNDAKEIEPSESRSLQLQFLNSISLPVFTGTRIEGEGCYNIEVALVDSLSSVVVSHGPGSSSKVEIVVLEGDFDGDDRGKWTPEEFKVNMVREREGKKPLLTGDVVVTLSGGRGSVADIFFTDNSSWTRSRKFRLGARLLDDPGNIRVREAISVPFVVRDHRGELYKKHHPPALADEVWRLEKIGKDGAFHRRLKNEGINTVQDFLMLLFLDSARLRNILGTGMSNKMWEATTDHAQTCVLDKNLLLYVTSEKNGVVFNAVGQVKWFNLDGFYAPADGLSESDKAAAHQMVIEAFAHRDKIVNVDDESFLGNLTSESNYHHSLASYKSSQPEQNVSSSLDYLSPIFSVGGMSTLEDCFPDVNTLDRPYDHRFSYTEPADSLLCDPKNMIREFCRNGELQFFDTDVLLPSSGIELSGDITSMKAFLPCSKGWSVLLSVLRWCFLIKRSVARKGR